MFKDDGKFLAVRARLPVYDIRIREQGYNAYKSNKKERAHC
jgi:hypothetical protein